MVCWTSKWKFQIGKWIYSLEFVGKASAGDKNWGVLGTYVIFTAMRETNHKGNKYKEKRSEDCTQELFNIIEKNRTSKDNQEKTTCKTGGKSELGVWFPRSHVKKVCQEGESHCWQMMPIGYVR